MSNTKLEYVLDANVFMEAAKRYYAFDIAPAFWEGLLDFTKKGVVISIDRVQDEINKGKDELKKWCEDNFNTHFDKTKTPDVVLKYGELMRWAKTQSQYNEGAIREFAEEDNADAWVIAYAAAKDHVIVTEEVIDPNIKKKIPIPNVCIHKQFNLKYIDTFELLRRLPITL